MIRAPLAPFRREEGTSLILVLGFVVVFSITTAAIVREVSANERAAKRDDRYSETFHKAEAALAAGIDGVNVFDPAGDQPDQRVPASGWTPYSGLDPSASEESQPKWYAEKLNGAWTVHSTAEDGDVIRELEVKLRRDIDPEQIDLQSWQGVFSDNPPGTCINIENNAGLTEHLYTRGDLCIGNNGFMLDDEGVAGPNTTLYVGGRVYLGNNSYIGKQDAEILRATIKGGCWYGGKSRICSNKADSHIWAAEFVVGAPSITKPEFSLAWYSDASPGPENACEAFTGTPPSFDNNATRDTSLGDINPFSTTAYSCTTASGEITWTPGSPGTLNVNGVVFFDGNLNVTNNVWVKYTGRGTIYFNGDVHLDNNVKICPTDDCTPNFDFDEAMLVLVALHNGVTPPQGTITFDLKNNSIFQGAGYAVGSVYIANNCQIVGPIVADGVDLKNNAGYFTPLGDDGIPPGAPVNAPNVWSVKMKTWRQIK